MGDPIAKSFDCVQNMAKMPARPKFNGLVMRSDTIPTAKNTTNFEMRIANKNSQLTVLQSNTTKDVKMSDGSAKVPTNVFNPLVSAFVIIFRRPAI